MTSDAADIQNAMVAAFFQTVAAFLIAAFTVLVVLGASARSVHQDEAERWEALAVRNMEEARLRPGDRLDFASLSLTRDVEAGPLIASRDLTYLRTFDASHFTNAEETARQRNCLAEAIYYEARSEGRVGQLAVAEVVMNRVDSRLYPDTICDVVYEGSERRTGCQFTFTCDGSMEFAPRGRSWARAQAVAQHVELGFARPVTRDATHYHTVAVDPYWNDGLVRTRRIGTHIFYRFPTWRERRAGVVIEDRDA
jgi:hypothetical protein